MIESTTSASSVQPSHPLMALHGGEPPADLPPGLSDRIDATGLPATHGAALPTQSPSDVKTRFGPSAAAGSSHRTATGVCWGFMRTTRGPPPTRFSRCLCQKPILCPRSSRRPPRCRSCRRPPLAAGTCAHEGDLSKWPRRREWQASTHSSGKKPRCTPLKAKRSEPVFMRTFSRRTP